MERLILSRLPEWKNSPWRKPLILNGVRQVGKTWVLKELGRRYYDNTAYVRLHAVLRYWTQTNPPYEVDFLIQRENDIFPVEVKSEANTTGRSLKKFRELFPDQVRLCVRFLLKNLKLDGDVLNIPLFMADQTD